MSLLGERGDKQRTVLQEIFVIKAPNCTAGNPGYVPGGHNWWGSHF